MDLDPDPAIFVNDLQDGNKNLLLFCFLLFEGTFTSFCKDKVKKKSQNSRKHMDPTDLDSDPGPQHWVYWRMRMKIY
jgi:hypothetical protein